MTPTQRIIVDVLNIIKSNVFLPYEKNLIAGVDVIPEISVPYLLERLDLNRVELEDTLSKLHAKGFILDFRFESRSGTIPEGVTVVPPNDFLRRYDDYLDKNYTAITVDVANKKVCIGEQIVSLTKGKQVEIMAEIFSMNEEGDN